MTMVTRTAAYSLHLSNLAGEESCCVSVGQLGKMYMVTNFQMNCGVHMQSGRMHFLSKEFDWSLTRCILLDFMHSNTTGNHIKMLS